MIFDAHDAHQRDRVRELGIVGCDYEVTRPAQHQPRGDALTLHGRDRGFRDGTPALGVFQDYCWTPAHGVDAQLASIAQARHPANDSWRALTPRNATRLLHPGR